MFVMRTNTTDSTINMRTLISHKNLLNYSL